MQADQPNMLRKIYLIASLAGIIIIGCFVWFIIARAGLEQIEVVVVPSDARVTYQHGTINDGVNFLRTGNHTITISRDNFETRSYDITVTPDTDQLAITTVPANNSGQKYLDDHPDEDQRYETAGAILRQTSSDALFTKYPKLADLPRRHYSLSSVFTVDYSGADQEGNLILTITNSSTQGRLDALQWIRDNGFDVNSINIVYDDYTSPLKLGRQR